MWAESKKQTLTISFDDSQTRAEDIVDALTRGGYEPSGDPRYVSSPAAATPAPVEAKKAEAMLVGKVTAEELFAGFPMFEENARLYYPDPRITRKLKRIRGEYQILLFLGTWCTDSEAEAPKIIKALEAAGNPRLSLSIHGVDRGKRDFSGLAQKYRIENVPTTVVLKGGKETGRIVEYPQESAEADLLNLMRKHRR